MDAEGEVSEGKVEDDDEDASRFENSVPFTCGFTRSNKCNILISSSCQIPEIMTKIVAVLMMF